MSAMSGRTTAKSKIFTRVGMKSHHIPSRKSISLFTLFVKNESYIYFLESIWFFLILSKIFTPVGMKSHHISSRKSIFLFTLFVKNESYI